MGLAHLGGDGIDEPQDGSGVRAAFFLLDALAIFALTPTRRVSFCETEKMLASGCWSIHFRTV